MRFLPRIPFLLVASWWPFSSQDANASTEAASLLKPMVGCSSFKTVLWTPENVSLKKKKSSSGPRPFLPTSQVRKQAGLAREPGVARPARTPRGRSPGSPRVGRSGRRRRRPRASALCTCVGWVAQCRAQAEKCGAVLAPPRVNILQVPIPDQRGSSAAPRHASPAIAKPAPPASASSSIPGARTAASSPGHRPSACPPPNSSPQPAPTRPAAGAPPDARPAGLPFARPGPASPRRSPSPPPPRPGRSHGWRSPPCELPPSSRNAPGREPPPRPLGSVRAGGGGSWVGKWRLPQQGVCR